MVIEASRVDGLPATTISIDDRGLAYGDGLFETMRVHAGRIVLWDFHLARLRTGCQRLGLRIPDAAALRHEISLLLEQPGDAVLKLMLTRGSATRGYAASPEMQPRRIVMRLAAPPRVVQPGLWLHECTTRLPLDSRLAGIKHLNRLHQVLARAEVDAVGADEGLCLDAVGRVACATAANVFALIDDRLHTPAVDEAGVAGVVRAALLADPGFGASIVVGPIWPQQLLQADEVFLTNAVRGVMPVRRIGERSFTSGRATAAACAALACLGFSDRPV